MMLVKLIRKAKLLLKPLKKGDVLIGDCCDFGMGKLIERVMHGLVDIEGKTVCSHWCGQDTYRLTVELTVMPYYVLKAEVLTRLMDENGGFIWKERHFERRIPKEKIHDMILTGKLRRQK